MICVSKEEIRCSKVKKSKKYNFYFADYLILKKYFINN